MRVYAGILAASSPERARYIHRFPTDHILYILARLQTIFGVPVGFQFLVYISIGVKRMMVNNLSVLK